MYFRTGNTIVDGDADRQILTTMGANDLLPCVECLNVLKCGSPLPSARFVHLNCHDVERFAAATSDDVGAKADDTGTIYRQNKLKNEQTSRGIKYNP